MKGLLLISGGIDSPIAGHLMRQQGMELVALHFSQEPLTDNTPEVKSRKLSKMIDCEKFIVINVGKQLAELVKKCQHRLYYVLQRRLMLRIAEKIAKKEGCEYLITGDNLGQVGSQTLSNMINITKSIKIPILRPLLTNDKNETIAIARKIGTLSTSEGPEMCSILGPKHPATSSDLEFVEKEENNIDVDDMINQGISTIKEESL